jgi:hypothetical protein
MIDPGGNHPQAAQLAPVLMGDKIVWVVQAYSDLGKGALRLTRENPAGQDTAASVRHSGNAPQHFVDIVASERARLSRT